MEMPQGLIFAAGDQNTPQDDMVYWNGQAVPDVRYVLIDSSKLSNHNLVRVGVYESDANRDTLVMLEQVGVQIDRMVPPQPEPQ